MTTEADKVAELVRALGVTGNLLGRLTMLGVGDAIATCSNAASELTRLSAEVDRLRAERHFIFNGVEVTHREMSALQARAEAAEAEVDRLRAERDEARWIVGQTYWMALRYADGRKSYAVGMCNDAVRKGYEAGWLQPKATGGDPITPVFARDGMSDEWRSLEARAEASEAQLAALQQKEG